MRADEFAELGAQVVQLLTGMSQERIERDVGPSCFATHAAVPIVNGASQ